MQHELYINFWGFFCNYFMHRCSCRASCCSIHPWQLSRELEWWWKLSSRWVSVVASKYKEIVARVSNIVSMLTIYICIYFILFYFVYIFICIYNVLWYQLDSLCFKLYDMIMIGDLRRFNQCFWKISFIASINFCNVRSARVWRRVWPTG